MADLKPCPVCGDQAGYEVFTVDLGHGDFRQDYYVNCANLNCRSTIREAATSKEDAAIAWNTRHETKASEQPDECIEIREALACLYFVRDMAKMEPGTAEYVTQVYKSLRCIDDTIARLEAYKPKRESSAQPISRSLIERLKKAEITLKSDNHLGSGSPSYDAGVTNTIAAAIDIAEYYMQEKEDECPQCGNSDWDYDLQQCMICHYAGSTTSKRKSGKQTI